jgi:FkbM family methyltransferase
MVDVGAHHGSACIPFLDKGWEVHAFEPCAETRKVLYEKVAPHANAAKCLINAVGVSDKSEQGLSFYTSPESTGISSLSAFTPAHSESERIDVVTLTDYVESRGLKRVDFLKVDTEGHDLFVLKGYPFGSHSPNVIECEFEDSKTQALGYCWQDMADFLVAAGYDVWISEWHPIIRYGISHDWLGLHHYPCDLENGNAWGNILAFREGCEDDTLKNTFASHLRRNSRLAQLKRIARQAITFLQSRA